MAVNTLVVSNPVTTNLSDQSVPGMVGGRQGDMLVSEVHGRNFHATYRGNVFTTSVPAAGTVTLPTTLATLASKFCLVNPYGSGKYLELIRFDYFINSATEVANAIGMTKSNITTATLTSLTLGVINNVNINGGTLPSAVFYTAATHADTPVWYMTLFSVNATAVGKFIDSYYFNGTVTIPPGNCIDIVTSTATQANSIPQMVWAEWPL